MVLTKSWGRGPTVNFSEKSIYIAIFDKPIRCKLREKRWNIYKVIEKTKLGKLQNLGSLLVHQHGNQDFDPCALECF